MATSAPEQGSAFDLGAQRRWMQIAAVGVLLIGVAASAMGALAWRSSEINQSKHQLTAEAASVAQTISIALQRDADLTATARVMVLTTAGLTNTQFSTWFQLLDANNAYPGSFGLLYIERVPQTTLSSFQSRSAADPPFGVAPNTTFHLIPASSKPPYCLTRDGSVQLQPDLGMSASQLLPLLSLAASDLDYCAMPIDHLLQAAASTGVPAATTLSSLMTESALLRLPGASTAAKGLGSKLAKLGLVTTLTPVYSTPDPKTPAARMASLNGWVLGVVQASSILGPIVTAHPGLGAALSYTNPHGTTAVLARSGSTTGSLSRRLPLTGASPWSVTVSSVAPSTGLTPTEQGLIIFLGGLLVTILLFLLIRILVRSRERALSLVGERTAQLRHQALHDSLTDLPNRALIFDRVEQMLARARRDLTEIAVLFVDLDQFKDVNDTFGHAAGDHLLRQVGERFASIVQETDTVGRLAGDEFVILLEQAVGASRPVQVAERLLLALNEPFSVGPGSGAVTFQSASMGIATGLRDSAEQLISDADIALYEAKTTSPGRYVVFDPEMRQAVTRRLELEIELRTALSKSQFFLVYQPIFDLRHEGVIGVEALLRWRHPERGVVLPGEFIPTLEASSMILDVGRFVLMQATRQAATWQRAGTPLYVSVNVSARQLERADFVDTVAHALASSGLAPELLTLEITETTLMRHSEVSVRQLRALKALGLKLAIDDFGTGYCSLSYLQQFPVDAIKIDQSFVAQMVSSPEGARLVQTIVQLGKDLGLETVAEGIETPAQLQQLQLQDCLAGQGFLLGRPLDVSVINDLLAATGNRPHLEPAS